MDSFSPEMSFSNAKRLVHIIDDDDDMRMMIKYELKDDYSIIDSANGIIGFNKTMDILPDLVISDIQMPGINGLKLCKLLKENLRTRHIPIILITGNVEEGGLLNGLEHGADDYVIKPFNFDILRARVGNLIKIRHQLLNISSNRYYQSPDNRGGTNNNELFLRKAYGVVEQNIDNPAFEANDFARAIGMSRAQIYRKIKIATGLSVKDFVRVTRLKKAEELLTNTDSNISEIAYQVGFSSIAYFSTSFSRYFKISPTKYILLNRKINR